jgi:hypothetical protein
MNIVTKEGIAELPAGDLQLARIEWRPDMSLVLTLLLSDKRRAHLTATFARHLHIGIEFDERSGGYPLTWDTIYSELPAGGWHVLMDFAHAGEVEFDCSELHIDYATGAF